MARAPDIVNRSFEFHGDAARALASLLALPPTQPAHAVFELAQDVELRALPARDSALRSPDGTLSSELSSRGSQVVRETAHWDPAKGVLRLEGYVADGSTMLPATEPGTFSFSSPAFSDHEIDALPGWKAVFAKARSLHATVTDGREVRSTDVALDGSARARLKLVRYRTWDSKSQPVDKNLLTVTFGATAPRGSSAVAPTATMTPIPQSSPTARRGCGK